MDETKYYHASTNPLLTIAAGVPGNEAQLKLYRPGYEHYLNETPVIDGQDAQRKRAVTLDMFSELAQTLKKQNWAKASDDMKFNLDRTTLAIDDMTSARYTMVRWKSGLVSQIHAHDEAYQLEALISGKILSSVFHRTDPFKNTVRYVRTDIVTEGVYTNFYHTPADGKMLIHSAVTLLPSTTLHFVSDVDTAKLMSSPFNLELFDDKVRLTKKDVVRISEEHAARLQIGDVVLVKSNNVPELGMHYIIIEGEPVTKPHGLRPQTITIPAGTNQLLLDPEYRKDPLVLLKLNEPAARTFLKFHNIERKVDRIILPE
jgi:hypothetical protein